MRGKLILHPTAQLGQQPGLGREAAAFVVRGPERQEVVDRSGADLADEAPNGGIRPVRLVREHVAADQMSDPFLQDARGVQAGEECAGHLRPDRLVIVEVALGESVGLADVVEERGQPDHRSVRRRIDGAEGVIPQVFADDLVLREPALSGEGRDDHGQQPGPLHEPQTDGRTRGGEELDQLGRDAFAREVACQLGVPADCRDGLRLNLELERG